MKHLILFACLVLLTLPQVAKASGDNDRDDYGRHHRRVSAVEMGSLGAGAAALLGVAGFLALRRKKAA